jgi:hypothetical protein
MAGQSWCINIVPSGSGVELNPDVWGATPGAPLQAQVGDLVSWSNQTDDAHQISISGETLDSKAWGSTSAYQIQNPNNTPIPFTIAYTCSTAQGDQSGLIDVVG